jgi:hypothetical protein
MVSDKKIFVGILPTKMAAKLKIEKRGDEIKKKSSPLKLVSQSQPNFAEMFLGWSPFKNVSVSAVLYPRWSPLLKIKNSSNGQNCSILSFSHLKKFLFLVMAAILDTGRR